MCSLLKVKRPQRRPSTTLDEPFRLRPPSSLLPPPESEAGIQPNWMSVRNPHPMTAIIGKSFLIFIANPLSERSPQGPNIPNPNAPVTLPPEILDKILEYVPTDREGRPTLMACSLVATWWTGPSQRCLFSSVSIHEGNYHEWMSGVVRSESKALLLGYVRSLWYDHCRATKINRQKHDLAQDSGEYLSALHRVRSLALCNIRAEHISEEFPACFSAFRGTLTSLSFTDFPTSFSAFVTLVDYFPNITSLRVSGLKLEPDEGPVPPLSQPLRGEIHVHDFPNNAEFLDRLAKLNPKYETLGITSSLHPVRTDSLESALRMSPSTIKFLRLTVHIRGEWLWPSSSLNPLTFVPEILQRSTTSDNSESWS